MKTKKVSTKSITSSQPSSVIESNLSESTGRSSWLSHQLLAYYKQKSTKLEKDYDELLEIVESVKSACEFSHRLQLELRLRDEEISKLQQLVGDLQVNLFCGREENLRLIRESDELKIQDYENKKKINLLLLASGATEKKFCHIFISDCGKNIVESKLPPKLKKLKEQKQMQLAEQINLNSKSVNEYHDQIKLLTLKNESLASALEQHLKISKEQVEVLIKEKELLVEEKNVGIQKLHKEVDFLSSKLKENQDLLCSTTEKLVSSHLAHEKDKTLWMEEKDKHMRLINLLKIKLGEDVCDICDCSDNFVSSVTKFCSENEIMRQKISEKEKLTATYQEQVLALQNEISKFKEREETCKKIFKEKTEKMASQVAYVKGKYEDLNRRRHLEAEGFRTDIKILRERLKVVEKKFEKASNGFRGAEQKQLLNTAKNTLNRAKLLEKELACMKAKICALESET